MKKGSFSASVITKCLTYLAIFLPAAFGFLYVYLFGVNVIVADEWILVRDLEELSSGTLSFSDLFAQHNSHRIFFPRIVMLTLASITNYSTVAEMYLIEVCFLAVLVALLLVFRNSVRTPLPFFVPIALLVFNPSQYGSMLLGFNLSFIFPQTFGMLTFFLIYLWARGRFEKLALGGAIGSATIAAFSSAHGLLVWPVGLLQLLMNPSSKPSKKLVIRVWALIGTIEWIIYFIGFERSGSILYALHNPLRMAEYFLTALGGSLFWQHPYAAVAGGLLVCLAMVSLFLIYRSGQLGESSFWIALLLFSLLSLVFISAGRLEYAFVQVGTGVEQALTSRYATYSILAVIGIYAMLMKLVADRRSQITTALAGVLLGLILVSLPAYYAYGLEKGEEWKAKREGLAFILATYKSQPDESLKRLYPNHPSLVKSSAPTLQKLDYNVFSKSRPQALPPRLSELSAVSSSTLSDIAAIDGKRVNNRDQSVILSKEKPFVRVTGWAVDSKAKEAAGGVYIDIDGELFPAFYGRKTNRLAERFDVAAYQNSGFTRDVPISNIGGGSHELSLVILTSDRDGYYRSGQKVTLEFR